MTSRWVVIWQHKIIDHGVASFVVQAHDEGRSVIDITNAMNEIDLLLSTRPEAVGESWSGSDRVLIIEPLVVTYEIHDEERVVLVIAARYAPRG